MRPSDYGKLAVHGTAFVCGLLWFRDSAIDLQRVTGSSMAPTLAPLWDTEREEDQVLVSHFRWSRRTTNDGMDDEKLTPREKEMRKRSWWSWNVSDLQRGDIVTFYSPVSSELALKRVVALGGDTVVPERRMIHGKGYRLLEKGDAGPFDGTPRGMPQSLTVPFGHIWVEGDNHYSSQDSRDFGPV